MALGPQYAARSAVVVVSPVNVRPWKPRSSQSTSDPGPPETVGSVGSGVITSAFAPQNPAFSKPYFTMPANAITAMAAGNTIVLQTHPAAISIWIVRVIPAGCGSLAGDKVSIWFGGETA